MNKFFHTFALLLIASTIFTSCNNASNRGIVINGVRWATHNVETSGTFARNPESAGGLFTFEEAQNACPRGWRLPTREELESLRNVAGGEWTTRNGVNGRTFGTVPNQLFLPAAGDRSTTGGLSDVGVWGLYWSSTQGISTAWAWLLRLNSGGTDVFSGNSADGLSVRCVAE